jgi:hypothetical protein
MCPRCAPDLTRQPCSSPRPPGYALQLIRVAATRPNGYLRGGIATRIATITGELVAERERISRRRGRYDSSADI